MRPGSEERGGILVSRRGNNRNILPPPIFRAVIHPVRSLHNPNPGSAPLRRVGVPGYCRRLCQSHQPHQCFTLMQCKGFPISALSPTRSQDSQSLVLTKISKCSSIIEICLVNRKKSPLSQKLCNLLQLALQYMIAGCNSTHCLSRNTARSLPAPPPATVIFS